MLKSAYIEEEEAQNVRMQKSRVKTMLTAFRAGETDCTRRIL
jgi:hypothetical protein